MLVKSEQKRKITVLLDTINKLRQRVRTTNDEITKEENHLHDIINDIRQQLDNLHKKKRAYRFVHKATCRTIFIIEPIFIFYNTLFLHINCTVSSSFVFSSCYTSKKREDIAQMVRDEIKGKMIKYYLLQNIFRCIIN